MPRRKLQFSLLTLFVLITLCAAGLAWWFSQPPRVRLLGSDIWQMDKRPSSNARAYIYMTQYLELHGPRAFRGHATCILAIAPPDQSQAPYLSDNIPAEEPWLVHWTARSQQLGEEGPGSEPSLTFIYNAAQETIIYDDTTLKCPPFSLIVIEFEDDGQASLAIEDGSFEDIHLHPHDLEQVRDAYTKMRGEYED